MDATPAPDAAPITVDDVMTSGVLTLAPGDTVARARELMIRAGINGLPVVDPDGVVVGIVTSSDLVEAWPLGEPVDTLMSRHVKAVQAGTPVSAVAAVMLDNDIHHLVVERGDQPIGVVTSFDLLRVVAGRLPSAPDPS